MTGNIVKLLGECKTYLWALRHCQARDLTENKIQEIKEILAADGIDLSTLAALRQLETSIARGPYPSVQRATYNDFYFFPIPAFDIEVFLKP